LYLSLKGNKNIGEGIDKVIAKLAEANNLQNVIVHEYTKEIDALREALVNILIHTNYFSPMKPRIRVFIQTRRTYVGRCDVK